MTMPNKTFYIAEADLPLLEQAQKKTGNNISVTIVQALQQLVHTAPKTENGFEDIVVKVGTKSPYQTKQFKGKLLAVKRVKSQSTPRLQSSAVYQTPKGLFALRSKQTIDWASLAQRSDQDWEEWNESDYTQDSELRLDIYQTLEEMSKHIPEDLYKDVVQALSGSEIEVLDL